MTTTTTALDAAAPAVAASMSAGERLHALDSLRAAAMLLGIVLHAGISLAVVPVPWPARDVSASEGMTALVGLIHGFRMQVFFLLAGLFGHLVWRRLGTRGFLAQRGTRIGIPFVAGLILIIPLLASIWKWSDSITGGTYAADRERNFTLLSYPTAHLWFLEMLLILYAIAMVLGTLRSWPPVVRLLPRIDDWFERLVRQPFKPLLLMVPTLALLWGGPHLPEIETAGQYLFPAPRAVAYYALFFGFGWWLHRRIHLLDQMRRWVGPYLAVGLVCFLVVGISMKAATTPLAAQHWTAIKLTCLTAAALEAWCLTFAVTGLFLRYAGGHRPWVRYVADASYWWYLWHLPIVMVLQVWIAQWQMNGWLKLLFMLAVTMAILLPSYHTMVRYTWVGRILNGPRERA